MQQNPKKTESSEIESETTSLYDIDLQISTPSKDAENQNGISGCPAGYCKLD